MGAAKLVLLSKQAGKQGSIFEAKMSPANGPTVEVPKDEQVDDGNSEALSSIGTTIDSAMSCSSLGCNYVNGRRYHAFREGRYPLPNDEGEQYRGDLNSYLFKDVCDGKLFLAPLRPPAPQKVLELGTGTGSWAIDMGERFPDAQVVGVDLSRIQPGFMPNVDFQVDDVESEWLHPTDFDFIFLRELSVYIQDPRKLFERAFQHLKPGGWIECQDLELAAYSDDGSLPEGAPLQRLFEVIRAVKDIGEHYGAENHNHLPLIGDFLREAGFTRVEKTMDRKIPWSPWAHHDPRELYWGKCMSVSVDTFLPFAPKLLSDGGIQDPVEIDKIIEGSRRAVRDDRVHPYSNFIVWIAQKPL
ncbi:hypothetical protein SLS62_010919 [Diatrype stigma]|uniref:Methyltransferase n=1 Tax=Diatrype stigma TaxID=117547 RepID=A0AAN9YF23_9PEZI